MEKIIETIYKIFQKKSDSDVIENYKKSLKKSKNIKLDEIELLENNNRLIALKKIIQERNLEVKKITKSTKHVKQENPNNAFKDGWRAVLIGVLIIIGSLGLMRIFPDFKIVLIGVIIGGLKFIQGIVVLAIGGFYKYTGQ